MAELDFSALLVTGLFRTLFGRDFNFGRDAAAYLHDRVIITTVIRYPIDVVRRVGFVSSLSPRSFDVVIGRDSRFLLVCKIRVQFRGRLRVVARRGALGRASIPVTFVAGWVVSDVCRTTVASDRVNDLADVFRVKLFSYSLVRFMDDARRYALIVEGEGYARLAHLAIRVVVSNTNDEIGWVFALPFVGVSDPVRVLLVPIGAMGADDGRDDETIKADVFTP